MKRRRGVWNPLRPAEQRDMEILYITNKTFKTVHYIDENGEHVGVFFNPSTTGWILTAMTEPELDAWRDFFLSAIERARPIVQRYDDEVRRAIEERRPQLPSRAYRQPHMHVKTNHMPPDCTLNPVHEKEEAPDE